MIHKILNENNKKDAIEKPPLFVRKNSIPIWIVGITIAVLLAYLFGKFFHIQDELQAITFLNTNVELLVTILAVTMSFTVLGLQFLAESYTPRALSSYLRDKVVYGFPILYIFLISLNLISSTFTKLLPPLDFLQYAVIGTIFSLFYLVGFIYYIIYKIQPERLVIETTDSIDENFWKRSIETKGEIEISSKLFRPFIVLEQIAIKSVANNDIFSFEHILQVLFKKLETYLDKIQKEFEEDKDPAKHGWNSYYVYMLFFRMLSPLISESLRNGREQFIIQYQWHMFRLFSKLYMIKHTRAIDDFWKQLDYLGHKIFNLEMISASDQFLSHLNDFMKLELVMVKKTKRDWPKDSMGYRKRTTQEIEIDILSREFSLYRIKIIEELGVIAAEKRIESHVQTIFSMLRDLINEIIKINDVATRRSEIYSLSKCVEKIFVVCLDTGINSSIFTTGWLDNHIQGIDKRRMDEAVEFTKNYCKLSLLAIEKGKYFEIHELGAHGRILVNDYPKVAIILGETLEKCIPILKKEQDHENRESYIKEIIENIESIMKWNKHKHIEVTEKINQILDNIHQK